jgi:polyisoprenoid-binding protein YceI
MMNNKAHEALKAKKHPSISFTQDKPIEINKNQQNYFVPGQLTIAGKTNSVTIPVHLSWNEKNELKVTGDIELKMTDFDMEPPSVMFGSINTDDLVKVSFSISLK